MSRVVLVVDKFDYKDNESVYVKKLQEKIDEVKIVYTEYEDKTIRRVRRIKGIGKMLQHLLYWKKSIKYANQIIREDYDKIICINPVVGLFLGLKNIKRNKHITLCGFLFEPKSNNVYYWLRLIFVKKCMLGIDKAVVYSKQEVKYYEKEIGINNKFVFVPYGIDFIATEEYKHHLPSRYIFSGGGSNRDYETLFKAYNQVSMELPTLVVATIPSCIVGIDTGMGLVLHDVTLETFGNVAKKADFMVLSLKDSKISAGHQVMLEALKNNMLIIVNRISAVEDYVSENEVLFYESGNIEELKELLKEVNRNYPFYIDKCSKGRELYLNNYTFEKFLLRLLKIS